MFGQSPLLVLTWHRHTTARGAASVTQGVLTLISQCLLSSRGCALAALETWREPEGAAWSWQSPCLPPFPAVPSAVASLDGIVHVVRAAWTAESQGDSKRVRDSEGPGPGPRGWAVWSSLLPHGSRLSFFLPHTCFQQTFIQGATLVSEWFYLGEITRAGTCSYLSVYRLKLLGLHPKSTEVSGSLSTYPSELWWDWVSTQTGCTCAFCLCPIPFLPTSCVSSSPHWHYHRIDQASLATIGFISDI